MHSASASDSSNPAIVPSDAFTANSLQLATPVAGAQNVNSASRFNANSSRPTASTSTSASQAHSLSVTGAPERSIPLAVSDTGPGIAADRRAAVSNATASSSNAVQGSPFLGDGSPNANSNELDPLFAASGSIDSASAAFSAGANQASDVAAASDRKAVPRSNSSADQSVRSARSTPAGQHASSAEPAAGLGPRGASPAQGNPSAATSTIAPTVSPLAASASGSGPAPGSNLGSVSSSSNTATAVSPGETFAALDGDASTGSFSWTHAGANRAEAGFEDPALGWVGVRADLGAGSVHATLVPGSPEAAQMLGSHLAGLNDYLAERHPAVGTVTVAEHENGGSFRNAQSGSGTESGSQSSSQQSSRGNSETNSHMVNPTHNGTRTGSNPISHAGEGNNQALPSNSSLPASSLAAETLGRSSGSRISVMA